MKNKLVESGLAGVIAGITVYVLIKWWNDHKRKSSRKQEEALARAYRKKYPHEFGEYTL